MSPENRTAKRELINHKIFSSRFPCFLVNTNQEAAAMKWKQKVAWSPTGIDSELQIVINVSFSMAKFFI